MKLTLDWKIRISFTAALISALIITGAVGISLLGLSRPVAKWIVVCIAGVGLTLLIGGALSRRQRREETDEGLSATLPDGHHPLAFFKGVGYWGWILLLIALPILWLSAQLSRRPTVVQATTLSKPAEIRPPELATPVLPPPPAQFPELQVDGLVYNGGRSTAVINGETLCIGDRVQGAQLVAIEPWGVTMEFEGTIKSYRYLQ